MESALSKIRCVERQLETVQSFSQPDLEQQIGGLQQTYANQQQQIGGFQQTYANQQQQIGELQQTVSVLIAAHVRQQRLVIRQLLVDSSTDRNFVPNQLSSNDSRLRQNLNLNVHVLDAIQSEQDERLKERYASIFQTLYGVSVDELCGEWGL